MDRLAPTLCLQPLRQLLMRLCQWQIRLTRLAYCSPAGSPVDSATTSTAGTIIDFPNLGLTYNGGWCTATETDETLITRPSREINVK